jgi:hypothetical protein
LPIGVCTSFTSPIISNFDADSDALWFLENVKVLAASRMENVWEDEGWWCGCLLMCANRLSEGSASADEGSVELELKRADEEDVSYTLDSAELVPLLLLAPESSSKEC